ncbi:hypothetical protein MRX96_055967 [Rhipicephalus microplus]
MHRDNAQVEGGKNPHSGALKDDAAAGPTTASTTKPTPKGPKGKGGRAGAANPGRRGHRGVVRRGAKRTNGPQHQ